MTRFEICIDAEKSSIVPETLVTARGTQRRGTVAAMAKASAVKFFVPCCILIWLINEPVFAQPGEFRAARYKNMPYQLFEPEDLSPGDRVPLVVGLHGAGKRNMPISKVLMKFHTFPADPEFQKRFPCYILAPKTSVSWFPEEIKEPGWTPGQVAKLPDYWKKSYAKVIDQLAKPPENGFGEQEILFELIDELLGQNKIDATRIYIVGFSMGGSGTWQAVAARPDFFAAAIPAAGGRLFPWQWNKEVLSVPLWAFQGSEDDVTAAERHQTLFEYAKSIGGNMKYTEFEGAGHGITDYVFTPSGEI